MVVEELFEEDVRELFVIIAKEDLIGDHIAEDIRIIVMVHILTGHFTMIIIMYHLYHHMFHHVLLSEKSNLVDLQQHQKQLIDYQHLRGQFHSMLNLIQQNQLHSLVKVMI